MNLKHRLQRSFKPRFAIIYPFGFFFLIFGSINDHSLRLGIGYIITGLLIRLWSNGYAIKNDKLTTSGPYALVRNPLYLGTFLIALGFVFVLQMGMVVGGLFMVALSFMYYKTIQDEQGMLVKKFGKTYQDYCAKVPAMIPALVPYTQGEQWPFSLERLMKSKEYKSLVWITVIIIAFYLKTYFLLDHRPPTQKIWGLVLLAALLIAFDIFLEINKKIKKIKAIILSVIRTRRVKWPALLIFNCFKIKTLSMKSTNTSGMRVKKQDTTLDLKEPHVSGSIAIPKNI